MAVQQKVCSCKGIRTCLKCESLSGRKNNANESELNLKHKYQYCAACKKAWEMLDQSPMSHVHPDHHGNSIEFPGIYLVEDFISKDEENCLIGQVDKTPWVDSQSGRRKQDYGPKVNFKKKKINMSIFTGLPQFFSEIYGRMKRLDILQDFIPVELCNLEYTPQRGSSIDAHYDDFWLWGDRLVTINLLSETTLTMTRECNSDVEVAVRLPARSLVVVSGPARTTWKHGIHRHDIQARRLAMTVRELTPEFLHGGSQESLGQRLIELALSFRGVALVSS